MNTKAIIAREKEHFRIITRLEQDLKNASDDSRRKAIKTKISMENADFRRFSISVLKEALVEIDKALKRYASNRTKETDRLQKIIVADRIKVTKCLKELGENV